MSKNDRPTKLYFKGTYTAEGRPLEWFGGMPGEYDPIPARDLGPEDTAALTEAQWAVLESENGKRLYQKTEPAKHDERAAIKPEPAPSSTAAPSAES